VRRQVIQQAAPAEPQPLPDSLPGRMRAVRQVVEASPQPLTPEDVAARFHYARRATVRELLETLEAVGQAEQTDDGRFAG
jgi:response regulator of citrate/malate metabolism